MNNKQLLVLNRQPIDWCYQCATSNIKSCDTKRLMFVWIVLQIFRGCERNWRWSDRPNSKSPNNQFVIKIDILKENTAIAKNLYNKKYWKLLIPIVDNQLNEFGIIGINYRVEIDRTDDTVHVWFDIKEAQNEKA